MLENDKRLHQRRLKTLKGKIRRQKSQSRVGSWFQQVRIKCFLTLKDRTMSFSETGYFFAELNSKDFSNLSIGVKIIKIISYIENIQHKHRYI